MSNFSLFPENLLLTWNEKPIVAKRFLMSQLKRLALETCQLAGKHAGKHAPTIFICDHFRRENLIQFFIFYIHTYIPINPNRLA